MTKSHFLLFIFLSTTFSFLIAQPTYEVLLDTSHLGASFRGASVVNDKEAWVCGSKGMVGKTTDGGKNWSFHTLVQDDKAELRDLEAWDGMTAVVLSVRNPARILKTTDGGTTWKITYEDNEQDIFLDGMDWWDKDRGIAYGDPVNGRFVVLTTEDGGETWQQLAAEQCPAAKEGEAGFAASGSGIRTMPGGWVWFGTGGTESNIFISSDFGKTWKKYTTPVVTGAGSRGINSLAFTDGHTGIIVGGDFTAPDNTENMYSWTLDGGKTWVHPQHAQHHPTGYRSCVEYVSKKIVLATGKNGTDISYDGGQNWERIDTKEFHVIARAKKGKWVLLAGPGKIGRLNLK